MAAKDVLSVFTGLIAGILTTIVYTQYALTVEDVVHLEPIDRSEYAVGENSYYIKLPTDFGSQQSSKKDVFALSSYLNQYSKANIFDPQFNNSMLHDTVKVLCYVISPHQFVGSNGKAIVKSWAYHCNELVVLSSIENTDLGVINIKLPEGKRDAWSRAKVAMQFVYDAFINDINDYDWFVKLEHDSVVVPENIRYMVLMHQANIPGYAGQVLSGEKTTGSVHILSKQALEQLVPHLPHCPDSVGGMADDLELEECLSIAGMSSSTDGRDEDGIQRFQIVMPDHKLPANTNGYTVWYWRYIRKPEVEGPECCSDYSISFHYVSPNAMYLLEYMIYHMKPFGAGHYTCPSHAEPKVDNLLFGAEGIKTVVGMAEEKKREGEVLEAFESR